MDSEFEKDVNSLIDVVLEEEKKTFQPGVESFQLHASKMRQKISDSIVEFQTHFADGYQVVCDGLDTQGFERPEIDEEGLAIFDDPDALIEALDEGRKVYELLGFTPVHLMQFYEIGCPYRSK